jgi:hypothetical protein
VRLNRAAGAAIAAGALVAMAAPVAIAAPAAGVADGTSRATLVAIPSTARPGQVVSLKLTCPRDVSVVAFGSSKAGTVTFDAPKGNVFRGTLKVRRDIKPGRFTVKATCSAGPPSGKKVSATTTVTITRKPTGGTKGGEGGSQGMSTAQMAAGGALAAAAVGAGVVFMRRRANGGRA